MVVDLEDQHNMVQEEALVSGVPNIRYFPASRTLPGPEDVEVWIEHMFEALTKPLTEKEKESGMYTPPQQRVLFEGTLDEAEAFYQQTKWIPLPVEAPIAVYTDGFPIRVPTEERVQEMLKGTDHRSDEVMTFQTDRGGRFGQIIKKGDMVRFQPRNWTATVEKVAINAVMAGCKPEYLPVVLAIAESGVGTGTTVFSNQWVC